MKKYKKGSELKPVPSDRPGLGKLPEKVRNAMGYMKAGGSMGNAMSAVKKGFDKAGAMITSKKAYGGSMVNKPADKMLIKAMQAGGPMDMVDVAAMKKGGCMKCGGSMKKLGGAVIIAKTKK
jgi:hypothetical protein